MRTDFACPVCHATLPEHEAYCIMNPALKEVPCELCDAFALVLGTDEDVVAMKRVGWEQVPDGWCCPACAESRERAINGEV